MCPGTVKFVASCVWRVNSDRRRDAMVAGGKTQRPGFEARAGPLAAGKWRRGACGVPWEGRGGALGLALSAGRLCAVGQGRLRGGAPWGPALRGAGVAAGGEGGGARRPGFEPWGWRWRLALGRGRRVCRVEGRGPPVRGRAVGAGGVAWGGGGRWGVVDLGRRPALAAPCTPRRGAAAAVAPLPRCGRRTAPAWLETAGGDPCLAASRATTTPRRRTLAQLAHKRQRSGGRRVPACGAAACLARCGSATRLPRAAAARTGGGGALVGGWPSMFRELAHPVEACAREAKALADCDADCETHCEAYCEADCEAECEADCEAGCEAECEADCEAECEADCETDCEADCETDCEASARRTARRTVRRTARRTARRTLPAWSLPLRVFSPRIWLALLGAAVAYALARWPPAPPPRCAPSPRCAPRRSACSWPPRCSPPPSSSPPPTSCSIVESLLSICASIGWHC
ncbi:SFRICE_013719 [Gryllus bimaculatus]|nr:SFRICE_013719 [Gryllus bimaculatus]